MPRARSSGRWAVREGPTFSVVIPAFNAADTVGEAFASLLQQSEESWEAIAVDDGSTDETYAVCRRFVAEDPRFHVVRHEDGLNHGPSGARNLALRHATGALVAFLDADDAYLPIALATFREAFRAWPSVDVVYGRAETFGGGVPTLMCLGIPGTPYGVFDQLARFNVLLTCTAAVRRSALLPAPFPESMRLAEDWACWLQLARHSGFLFLEQVVARRRLRPGSAMGRLVTGDCGAVIAAAQGRHLRSLLDSAGPEERAGIRRGLAYRASEALREAASRIRRRALRGALVWLEAALVISGSPRTLLEAIAQIRPEQRRIRRGEDPPLTLSPPPAPATAKR